jgi:uncharacterized protein (DUF697 family)
MTTQAAKSSAKKPSFGPPSAASPPAADSRASQARGIVRQNFYWAVSLGLIPIPIVDFLALTGVQVKMLKQLSDLYEVPFFEDRAKTIIGSLIAGVGGLSLAGSIARGLFAFVPLVGQVVAVVGGSAVGGALTLAVGNLFAMHYESGGTLLNFDADKMRGYFQAELERSQSSPPTSGSPGSPSDPIAP